MANRVADDAQILERQGVQDRRAIERDPANRTLVLNQRHEEDYTPGAFVLASVGQIGPMITTHSAGKMKIASGKMSFSCS